MHKSAQMNILLPTYFLKRGIIFIFNLFLSNKTDEVDQPWCFSSHDKFLGFWRSNFAIFWSTLFLLTCEQRGAITVLFVTLGTEVFKALKIIISRLFFEIMRFIRVHALMHMLSPVDVSSGGLHIYLELISADILGVGWRGGFSSYMVTPAFWRIWNLPGWVLNKILHTLSILLRWIIIHVRSGHYLEGSATFSRFLWLISVSGVFGGGYEVFGKKILIVSARSGLFVPSDIPRGLHSRRWVSDIRPLIWRCSLGILIFAY